jgi:hypothetical protein
MSAVVKRYPVKGFLLLSLTGLGYNLGLLQRSSEIVCEL